MATNSPNRRRPLKHNRAAVKALRTRLGSSLLAVLLFAWVAYGQGPVRVSLDQAIQMALQHNHVLTALRTTVQQSEAEEITQGLRPNPTIFSDWEYFPLSSPAKQNPGLYSGVSTPDYLKNNTEADLGLSYLIERGGKRLDRLQAQKDITAQTRSLVADSERGLSFQVATLFFNVQLAESTLDLAE
jgi:cobalt-zinc-cadmium efflux system outer membrane protein